MATHLEYSLMVNKYQQLFVTYLVICGSMLLSVGGQPAFGQDHHTREKRRAEKFIEGPNGVLCVLNPAGGGTNNYAHTSNGIELSCDLCQIGEVLVSNCTSDRRTECRLLTSGEQLTMPYPNFCTSGYPCKTCPGPSQTVKELCEPGQDTICECAEDYFSVNHEGDKCQPKPRCSKGFEPRPGAGTDGVPEMICRKCGDGLYQPSDSSTDHCRKHSNCTTTPGTDKSDSTCICKGGPQPSASPTTSSNEVVPPTTSTPVPIGPTSATPAGNTNPPDQTSANICMPWWGIVLTVIISGAIFIPLGFCFSKDLLKKRKIYKQAPTHEEEHEMDLRREDNPAQRQDQEMESRGGSTNSSTVVNMLPSNSEQPITITDLKTKKGQQDLRKRKQKRKKRGRRADLIQ